ncbi:MAG: hypothetical protein KDK70_25970 [Myxococcales bacterium]|nr:hypothetical protein [Myxococcales bacterium]
MRGLTCCLSIIVGAACSRSNPDYDDPRSSGTSSQSSDDGTGTTTGTDGEDRVCELHPDRDIRITLRRGELLVEPDCSAPGPLWLGSGGSIFPPPDRIIHTDCSDAMGACICNGTEYTIDFEGTVSVPASLPTCGPIALWTTMRPEGCEWGGVMVQGADSVIPQFVASRTLDIPVPPLSLAFDLVPDEICDDRGCAPAPGRYHLDVLGDIVPVEGSPHPVSIELPTVLEVLPYRVDNRMSSIDEDCRTHVAWTAVNAEL